jgi:hypothetical protein
MLPLAGKLATSKLGSQTQLNLAAILDVIQLLEAACL